MSLKYAFLSSSLPDASFDDLLSAVSNFEYDGIELRVLWKHKHGIELEATPSQRADARAKAADAGVEIACISTSLRFAVVAESEQTVADCRKYIKLASDIGCSRLRVFGGDFISGGSTQNQAVETAVANLRSVAVAAEDAGVMLCLETHDAWCDPKDIAGIVSRVDSSAVGVLWDILHPVRAGKASIRDSFDLLKPYIRHVHIHDGFSRSMDKYDFSFLPIGEGIVNHALAIKLLRDFGYTGFLSGEWINWEPGEIHLPREREICRKLEAFM